MKVMARAMHHARNGHSFAHKINGKRRSTNYRDRRLRNKNKNNRTNIRDYERIRIPIVNGEMD